jgi:hypothetical protein
MFTLETEFKYKNVQFLIGLGEVYRLNIVFHLQDLLREIPFFSNRILTKISDLMGFSSQESKNVPIWETSTLSSCMQDVRLDP